MHRITALSLRHPAAAAALWLALCAASALGAARLAVDAGYRAILGESHPAIHELDAFAARFGGGLPFAAVWSCEESSACERALDPASLALAAALADALGRVPGVHRVDGPASSRLLVPQELGLPRARQLWHDGAPAPDRARLAARALQDPTWVGQILSPDGRAAALLVHLESSDSARGAAAVHALLDAVRPFEARGFRVHLVGGPVEFVVAGEELVSGTARLVPVMVAIVAAVLLLLCRSLVHTLAVLLAVGAAALATLGAMGGLGWPQTSITQVLPPLVLVIGVCDAIHLLAAFSARGGGAGGCARAEARLIEAAREVGPPCWMTTLTTAAGFASFAGSGLESLARFGALAAFGVCAALLACFSLLPLLLARLPARRLRARLRTDPTRPADDAPAGVAAVDPGATWARALGALAGFAERRSRALCAAALALALLSGLGLARLRVDASFEDLYGEQSRVVVWARAASRHLREPETLEVALTLPTGVEPFSPEALRALAALESLAGLEGLTRPLSLLTPLRELHRAVHRAPLDLDSAAGARRARGLLRLLSAEDPGLVALLADPGEGGGALRVSFQARKLPQAELGALLQEARARASAALPAGFGVALTGPLAVVAALVDELRRTQLQSFAWAGALVLLLVGVFFRSASAAALAAVPTGLPVLTTLGAMGALGVPLDVGTAMVAAVVLGLAVDDAIHWLQAYRARRTAGALRPAAAAGATARVGRALVTTSLALATGFSALALAPWRSIASFGGVCALAILSALAAVLLVLPALLLEAGRWRDRGGPAR